MADRDHGATRRHLEGDHVQEHPGQAVGRCRGDLSSMCRSSSGQEHADQSQRLQPGAMGPRPSASGLDFFGEPRPERASWTSSEHPRLRGEATAGALHATAAHPADREGELHPDGHLTTPSTSSTSEVRANQRTLQPWRHGVLQPQRQMVRASSCLGQGRTFQPLDHPWRCDVLGGRSRREAGISSGALPQAPSRAKAFQEA